MVSDAHPRRLIGAAIDVTPEYMLAEARALMLREMNYRVKNLFAIVGGMLSAGARVHDDVRSYSNDMRDRIAALGRAHSLAAPTGVQQSIELRTLLATTLAPYDEEGAISIDGPDILIDRAHLSPLALILHEWATNAAKYGVLGLRRGRLDIQWRQEGNCILLEWQEIGGEALQVGNGNGFGTVLVSTSVRQLRAELERNVSGNSFTLRLKLPVDGGRI